MRNHVWIVITAVFGMSSCNMQAHRTTDVPVPTPMLETPTSSISTPTPVSVISVQTVTNLDIPTVTPTSTPSVILASAKDQPVNCRFGPGISYAVIGALEQGKQAEMIGRNSDSTWWFVRNPTDPSTSCWLSAEFVQTVGDVQSLPEANSPVIMVTNVYVTIDPPVMNIACNAFPQVVTINAQISASGPSNVVWHWESSTGFVSPDKNLLFDVGDTKFVQDLYQVNGVNDYMIKVQTTLPNIMTGQASFKVVCTP